MVSNRYAVGTDGSLGGSGFPTDRKQGGGGSIRGRSLRDGYFIHDLAVSEMPISPKLEREPSRFRLHAFKVGRESRDLRFAVSCNAFRRSAGTSILCSDDKVKVRPRTGLVALPRTFLGGHISPPPASARSRPTAASPAC